MHLSKNEAQLDSNKTKLDSWGSYTASGSESTEREQTPYSTHLIRVYFYS